MKANIFRVKEKKRKKIIIEEERTKNPFLIYLKRHKTFIASSTVMLSTCLLLVAVGLAFSLFEGSSNYDITYVNGGEDIDINNDPEIEDEDIKDELLGEVAREEGIVILTETIMSQQGDVIYYYTDKTAVIVKANGRIYRVSSTKNGDYGVNRNGKIDENAKRVLVTSTTSTLMDGTIITYYSDGSAKVELKSETVFIRDSNNIKIDNGQALNNLAPSGVALAKDINRAGANTLVTFTDKTSLVTINGKKYIINKNTPSTFDGTNINYNRNNMFAVLQEKTYSDGNIITHYENGSATITDKNGNVIYVKKSGDLLLKKKKLYEILKNEYGFSRNIRKCSDGTRVTYFDDGSAVIIPINGKRQYVEDSTEIIYDENNKIISSPNVALQISERETTDNEKVFNFSNGKSQVIRKNGSSYIINTDELTFKPSGGIANDPEDDPAHGGTNRNPGEGIYISEAEHVYNNSKNIENSTFIIKNNNTKSKVLRVTIEEVSDYRKYNTSRLEPRFVKFQATVGDNYIPATTLTQNTWIDEEGTTNYIIYDGTLPAKSTQTVAIALYVDYTDLDNSYQNKGFIGTIKVYVEDDLEDIQ